MADTQKSRAKAAKRPAKVASTYRGIRIQGTGGSGRFTIEQIKQAVEAAVSKNADALAGRIKV